MNPIRGFVMLIASAVAFWRGWQIHHGPKAVLACALGVLALALAAWHLTRRSPRTR